MGIYSKNREEWLMMNIANMKNSVTTVAIYDTLGPAALAFVLEQTALTSIACAGQFVQGLIEMKRSNAKAEKLENLIVFDEVSEEIRKAADEVGLKVFTMQDVIKEGKDLEQKPIL